MQRFFLAPIMICVLALASRAAADVVPHALFSDGAVLQRGMKVPVWGTADNGEKITVRFQGQEVSAVTADGTWRVELAPLEAGGPFEMNIVGNNTVTIPNLLVGEVWLASGQSNMEWKLRNTDGAEQTIKQSANPRIRLLTIARKSAVEPQTKVDVKWVECDPKTSADFSAVAYFFARDLEKQLKVPIGMINSSFGGTPAEAWTSQAALAGDRATRDLVEKSFGKIKDASGLYNAMIYPLIPYAMRGAIWYQGESNTGRANNYRSLLSTMVLGWRHDWGQGDFPFLIVQLAPHKKIQSEPGESDWADLREAQMQCADTLPNAALAVITDVGDEKDVHPRQKEPVGARLALAARAIAYGEKIEYSGPRFSAQRIDGDRIVLSFTHVGDGLVAKDGALRGFAIAGNDGKYANAEAEIVGDTVVVHSKNVAQPIAVRYGWADCPVVNLWNKAGLPAVPFQTFEFRP